MLSCIPKCLKDTIKLYCDQVNPGNFRPKNTFFDKIMINKKVKFIYRNLIDNICNQSTEKYLKWEEGLVTEISDWSKYFIVVKRSCRDTYLKNFQFKILHRIIPTNSLLYKIKIKDTQLCTFCHVDEETIEHLFYDCPVTNQFWLSFIQKVKLYYSHINFTKDKILLGFKSENLFINMIFIIAKNYIYRCKLKETTPNLTGLKCRIRNYQSWDFYIAKKNNRIPSFEKFWAPFQTIFTTQVISS